MRLPKNKLKKNKSDPQQQTRSISKTANQGSAIQKNYINKLPKPKYSHKESAGKSAHYLLSFLLPISVYLLVTKLNLPWVALLLVLASKWQIFIVKPRFWWTNLKFSATDLIFKLSTLALLVFSQIKLDSIINKGPLPLHALQISLTLLYIFWNLYLRRQSSPKKMLIQAQLSQFIGLVALAWASGFINPTLPVSLSLIGAWLISYASAQHTLYAYEESAIPQLASFWALTSSTLFMFQIVWAKNFIFFQSTIYLPLAPIVIGGLGLLLAKAHKLIEDQQSAKDFTKASLERRKNNLSQESVIAVGISLLICILISLS